MIYDENSTPTWSDYDLTPRQALHLMREASIDFHTSRDGYICFQDRENGYGLFSACSVNGSESGFLAQSNHDVALAEFKRIDERAHTVHISGFGGTDYIIVPLTEAIAAEAIEIMQALQDYPVLDEEDLSRREYEAVDADIAAMLKHDTNELTADEQTAVYDHIHESGYACYHVGFVSGDVYEGAIAAVIARRTSTDHLQAERLF